MSAAPEWTIGDEAMAAFSNKVQAWSIARLESGKSGGTFGDAASAFRVPVQQIADAVEWHYWMFSHDTGPLAEREIDHDGE